MPTDHQLPDANTPAANAQVPLPMRLPADQYKILLESFAQATWETDAQGLVLADSPSWRAYTGQTLAQWMGEGWVAAIHPEDRQYALHQWQQAVVEQRPVNAEFRLRSPDGGWRWTNVRATAILDSDGRVHKWVGLNIDISERKRAEEQLALAQNQQRAQELQATRNLLRATLDSSMDLIQVFEAVRDAQSELVDFKWILNNHAAETIYSNVIGKSLLQVQPGVVEEGIFDAFKQVVATGVPQHYETYYSHPPFQGWFYQSVVKLGDGVATTTANITVRKQAEEALKESDRRKDEFLAMLAHELRNPMAVLATTLRLLNKSPKGPRRLALQQALALMNREIMHLNRMVDDLLDVSRIRQGKIALRNESIDLTKLVQQTLDAIRPEFMDRRQLLSLAIAHEPLWVWGDAVRLVQIIRNLLSNAGKYTPEGGQIQVSLVAQSDQVLLQVKDNGIGLAVDQLEAIFGVFMQVATSLDRPQGGLGLGLPMIKQLAELHGGSVAVQSPGLGQGSEFSVTLPRLAQPSASKDWIDTKVTFLHLPVRLLVVDDQADLARVTALVLEEYHYEVHSCQSGEQALAVVDAVAPDVVLLDLGMPGLDGYTTCRRLREQSWGKQGLIVALSGYGSEEDRTRTQASGFDGHLLKPLDVEELGLLVASLLAGRVRPAPPAVRLRNDLFSQRVHDLQGSFSVINFALVRLRQAGNEPDMLDMLERNVEKAREVLLYLLA